MTFTPDFERRNRIEQVRLAAFTTMRIGGPATLVTLESRADLAELLGQPHRWLGRGANLLIGDDGVPEPVVRLGESFATLELGEVSGGRARVRVGAAVDLAELIAACVKAGFAGPEGLAGVPATVGGALRMNAGTNTCWMLDWVSRVEVVLPGETEPRWLERAALPAAYRSCGLPHGTLFLGCELELATADPALLKATGTRLKQAKAATQPLALASAGCVFKNPAPTMPAGKLIDDLGLKGEHIGAAEISTVHANFIVNRTRAATCADVVALIRRIRERAWRERGVLLTMEVETWNCPVELHIHPRELAGVGV
ncbi:MAG: FAD-binding protein [Planctomycetes bacterium]|nr:FAD-binding protein [Planctomycetota bacterium]